MRAASLIFRIAAIYGILVLAPQYFMEGRVGRDFPPPITHPENFYGFIGTALVWQFVFLIIARNPAKYWPLMGVAVLEKLAFGVPAVVLFAQGRLAATVLAFGIIDLVLASAFLISIRLTSPERAA